MWILFPALSNLSVLTLVVFWFLTEILNPKWVFALHQALVTPVTCLNMKELDALNWIKWDILGLDNVALINETCKMAGIERLTPDNVNLDDIDVWRSIRDDTTGVFQFESGMASNYLRRFMSDETVEKARARNPNFSMIKWLSFANGLLRPASASFRDDVADGVVYDNGLKELNDFLAQESGHVCMQETIMRWLVEFCGYSQAESDNVRRAIAKKEGDRNPVARD